MKAFYNLTLVTLISNFLTVTGAPSYSIGNQASPNNSQGNYIPNYGSSNGGNYGNSRPIYGKRPSRHPTHGNGGQNNGSNGNSNNPQPKPKPPTQTPDHGQTPSTPGSGGLDIQLMLQLVNAERAKVGAGPLTINQKLASAAQAHSDDQAKTKNMSHSGSDGSSPSERCQRAGYGSSTIGENVAWNQQDVNDVMKAWISSPGHYANIVNKSYKDFGAGVNNLYWTQVFGGGESGSNNSKGYY